MTQETDTALTSPPQAEQPLSPAPVELAETTPTEPRPEGEPPVGDEVGAEVKPWASMEAKDVLEHEDFHPLLEERDQTTYDRAYGDVQGRLQPLILKRNEAVESAGQSMEEMRVSLTRAVEDGTFDGRTAEDLLRRHRSAFEALNGVHQANGVGTAMTRIAHEMGLSIGPAVELAFNDWAAGKGSLDFLKDFAADVKAKAAKDEIKGAEDKGYQRGLKEGKAGQASQQKSQATGGPVVAPSSAGVGGDDNKKLLDPTTPHEELVAIRARQKAAGE